VCAIEGKSERGLSVVCVKVNIDTDNRLYYCCGTREAQPAIPRNLIRVDGLQLSICRKFVAINSSALLVS